MCSKLVYSTLRYICIFFVQVEELLKQHVDMFDRLNVRLGFAADDSCYRLRHALRRGSGHSNHVDALHQIAVIPDIKRQSPTSKPHEIANFPDAGDLAVSFRDSGAGLFSFSPNNISSQAGMSGLKLKPSYPPQMLLCLVQILVLGVEV